MVCWLLWKKEKMLITIIFSSFPTMFQEGIFLKLVKTWECVPRVQLNALCTELFTTQSRLLTTLRKKPFENTWLKGKIAANQHFLLFPQCFLSFSKQISIFQSHLDCLLQMLSIWISLRICCLVKS